MCFSTTNTINYVTTKPIRKIESELHIHFLNFNYKLIEVTVKKYGRQENSEF